VKALSVGGKFMRFWNLELSDIAINLLKIVWK